MEGAPTLPSEYDAYQFRSLYHRTVAEKEEEFVVNMLRPRQGRVLEVGPGTGRITRHLVHLAESLTVCDLYPAVLEKVAARLGPGEHTNYLPLAWEQLDRAPDFGRFDAAVAVRVVPHAADWRGAIASLFAAVRPGGLVLFDLWSRHSFVEALLKVIPRQEPIAVHRLPRREVQASLATLPGRRVSQYRWGYPRLGPFHLDELGALLAPSWAYSTLVCIQKQEREPA